MEQNLQANKAMIRRFVEDVKNKRQFDQMGEIFQTNYIEHNGGVNRFGNGVEGYTRFLNHLFTAFPDDQVKIDELIAEGNIVCYRATESGTHQAEFLGIPATHKSATWTEIQFSRIEDGKVAEHWIDVDIFSWFQQLGIIPRMG